MKGSLGLKKNIRSYVLPRSRTKLKDDETLRKFENVFFFSLANIESIPNLVKERTSILEVGFGDGENIIHFAKNNLDKRFYGVEVYRSGLATAAKKIHKLGLENITLIEGDVKELVSKIKEPSFDYIFFLFPDPWPKKKHKKRRLLKNIFMENLGQIIKPEGKVIIKTDWEDYAYELSEEFKVKIEKTDFDSIKGLVPIETKYERKGLKEGRKIFTYILNLNT